MKLPVSLQDAKVSVMPGPAWFDHLEERFSKKEGNLKKFCPFVIKAGAILLKVLDKPRQDD